MDEARFWKLVDLARRDRSADPQDLREVLDAQDDSTVKSFAQRFHQLLCELNQWQLWGAADVIGGGLSGDSFRYFRSWLIGNGRDAVRVALTDPDALGELCADGEEAANELLEYVAVELLEARGLGDPREALDGDPDGEPTGEPPPEQSFEMHLLAMRERYPRLTAQFSAG